MTDTAAIPTWARRAGLAIILLVLLLRPLVDGMTYPGSDVWFRSAAILALGCALVPQLAAGSLRLPRVRLLLPAALCALALALSVITAVDPPSAADNAWEFVSYLCLWLTAALLVSAERESVSPHSDVPAYLLVGCAVGGVIAGLFGSSLAYGFAGLGGFFLFLILLLARGTHAQDYIPRALLAAMLITCIYGLIQWHVTLPETRRILAESGTAMPHAYASRLGTDKVFSTFVHPPAFAGFLALALPVAVAWAARGRTLADKLAGRAGIFLGLLLLAMTFSKGGWLAAGAALLLLLAWMNRARIARRKLAFACGVALVALALIAPPTRHGLARVLPEKVSPSAFRASMDVRADYWRAARDMIAESPFLGRGPGAFQRLYPKYRLPGAGATRQAHNNYVQLWVEMGPVGLVGFTWLWLASIASALRRDVRGTDALELGCAFAVTAFLLHSIVDFDLYVAGIAAPLFVLCGSVCGGETVIRLPTRRLRAGLAAACALGLAACLWRVGVGGYARHLVSQAELDARAMIEIRAAPPEVVEEATAERAYNLQSVLHLGAWVSLSEREWREAADALGLPPEAEGPSAGRAIWETALAARAGLRLEQAVRIVPDSGEYRRMLGDLLMEEAALDADPVPEIERALALFREATALAPWSAGAWADLGNCLMWRKQDGLDADDDEIIGALRRARDNSPADPNYRVLHGRALMLAGRSEEALAELRAALDMEKQFYSQDEREAAAMWLSRAREWIAQIEARQEMEQ